MTAPIEQPPCDQLDLFDAENPQIAALRSDSYPEFMANCEKMKCGCCRIGTTNGGARPLVDCGNVRGRIAIIGDIPGKLDRQSNELFSGPRGQYLNGWIALANIPTRAVYKTTLVKCWPHDTIVDKKDPSQSLVKDRKASEGEIESCFPLLLKQLSYVKAHYIVFLGAAPAIACLGLRPTFKILDHCGSGIPLLLGGRQRALGLVIPAPNYFMCARDEVRLLQVSNTFRKIEAALRTSGMETKYPVTFDPLPEELFNLRKKPIFFERKGVRV